MPAPFTIVTFRDADGDEFPIRVELPYSEKIREQILCLAGERLRQCIGEGAMWPQPPVAVAHVKGA